MKHRIHLLALPNTQTTKDYSLCGFCSATRNFARMLHELGHEVILYASEECDVPYSELVTVITREEQEVMLQTTTNAEGKIEATPYQYAHIEAWSPIWQLANARTIREIGKRKQPRDFICSIGGGSQQSVAQAHPDVPFIEYSIGYLGSFSPFRVFESAAWQHTAYAQQNIDARFFDTVIPCSYEPSEFPFNATPEPFALYCGRLIARKGLQIACQAAEAAGVPLKIIGHGDKSLVTHGAEYLGALSEEDRNKWLSRASVVLTPTTYIEPFNQVAIEAQMCGTPVIATDFGGFTETIEHGRTGFRCSYLGEFVRAIKAAPSLDRRYIRKRAVKKYSMHNVKHQYQAYFDRVALLFEPEGWNSLK